MADSEGTQNVESISWRVRLSDNTPWKRYAVLAVALLIGVLGTIVANPIVGLSGFVVILGTTADLWLGTHYRIDAESATARTGVSMVKMLWTDARRILVAEDGIKVSPLLEPGKLDSFRGIFLRYGRDNGEEIESAVRRFCTTDVRFVDRRAE